MALALLSGSWLSSYQNIKAIDLTQLLLGTFIVDRGSIVLFIMENWLTKFLELKCRQVACSAKSGQELSFETLSRLCVTATFVSSTVGKVPAVLLFAVSSDSLSPPVKDSSLDFSSFISKRSLRFSSSALERSAFIFLNAFLFNKQSFLLQRFGSSGSKSGSGSSVRTNKRVGLWLTFLVIGVDVDGGAASSEICGSET